jgi:hypothetical protein
MKFDKPGQIALVVKDVEKATKYIFENFGIGPFTIINFDNGKAEYKGKELAYKSKVGLCSLGGVAIEVIEMIAGGPFFKRKSHGRQSHGLRKNLKWRFLVSRFQRSTFYTNLLPRIVILGYRPLPLGGKRKALSRAGNHIALSCIAPQAVILRRGAAAKATG